MPYLAIAGHARRLWEYTLEAGGREFEPLCERHRQATDDGPPGTDGIKIRSSLPEDRVDGLN
jgi:hypothetical protein